ncbi:MAG: hypothetical protein M1812_000916 [Candelaria pacifica]|nr:MAG: hypothetical protein M1812_000916 [Candelaria pacifica]
MSGDYASSNPFRRKPPVADVPPIAEHGGKDIDRPSSLQQDAPKTASRKQVRIKTPPSRYDDWSQSTPSTATFRQSSPDTYSLSTASDSSTSPEESPTDSSHHVSDQEEEGLEDEELLRNTRRNSSTSASVSQSTQGPPLNPFSTTLATLEGSSTTDSDYTKLTSSVRPKSSMKQDSSIAKQSLDVDSFKRLLLTGNSSHTTSTQILASTPAQAHMQPGIPGDSGSSTDASSISRQSIFEQTLDMAHDTPRSSHDISPSENEQRQSWSESPSSAERKKPPPPKSRHGKHLENQGPQTVPFEDPSVSSSSAAALPSSQPRPLPSDYESSLNKALPAPPSANLPRQETPAQGVKTRYEPEHSPQQPPLSIPTPQKRAPPPPPLARRHSQLRSGNATSNIAQPTRPMLDEQSPTTAPSLPSEPSISTPTKHPPPPPPPRHHGSVRSETTVYNPSTPPEPSTAPATLDPPEPAIQSPMSTSSAPLPPPSRTPSISSLKRPSRASPNTAAQAGMPPPPPPPRNRGSSQSSLDSRPLFPSTGSNRASGEFRRPSSESQRRTSSTSSLGRASGVVEGIAEVEPEGKGVVANDILGDLEALQREVDELRGRYATGKDG